MNVLDLLREMGIEPRLAQRGGKRGAEYWSRCPKAGCSQEDGFHVWPEQNSGTGSWWCRNCDRGGDNIQFCRDYMGMDFQEACDKCGRDPGPRPPRRPFAPKPSAPAWAPRPVNVPQGDLAQWREHAGKFGAWAHRQLINNPEALDYLDRRGVKRTVVERWGLGWNPGENGKPCIYRARKAWGLPEEKRESGRSKPLWLPRGIVIPWRDANGCLCKIRIRRHPPDMPPLAKNKYFVVPGSTVIHTAVYRDQPAAVVLETELDGLAAAEVAGDLVGVVATGTSGALPQPQDLAFLKRCQVILVALDFDRAGRAAWEKWRAAFPNARRWPAVGAKDVGEMFETGQDVRRWIMAGLPEAVTMRRLAMDHLKRKGGSHVPAAADVSADPGLPVEGAQPAAQPVRDADPPDGLADLSPDVQRVGTLLQEFPQVYVEKYEEHRVHAECGLVITYDGVRVVEPEHFQARPALTRELCNLVFLGGGVLRHILGHPAGRVNGRNYFGADA